MDTWTAVARERRAAQRYPLRLSAEYQAPHGQTGTGTVIDISTRGALLLLDRAFPMMSHMRVHVAWPAKLNGHLPLRLRLDARVIRANQHHIAVEFKGYEFVVVGRRDSAVASGERLREVGLLATTR